MAQTSPSRYAVIGNPVGHSKSPQIHTMFAAQTGQDLVYGVLPAPLDGFRQTMQDFFAAGGAGLNVTVPFKLDAFDLTRGRQSERAATAGAVNTLWMVDGALHGCNTDGVGLLHDLQRLGADLPRARVLLVGAGGAARGVLLPLLASGCPQVHVVNRTESRAHDLVRAFAGHAQAPRLSAGGFAALADGRQWDVVINATASSLSDAAPALPAGLYAREALAYDMVYGAQATAFMRQAHRDGAARTADGLGMLVSQAAESFFIWRGIRPRTEPVLAALRAQLQAAS